ncbi:MAG: hypothetical protein PWQ44_826 [Methanolobus sp.]|nr:hypothetical protein [Methanolobus sp.]
MGTDKKKDTPVLPREEPIKTRELKKYDVILSDGSNKAKNKK